MFLRITSPPRAVATFLHLFRWEASAWPAAMTLTQAARAKALPPCTLKVTLFGTVMAAVGVMVAVAVGVMVAVAVGVMVVVGVMVGVLVGTNGTDGLADAL